jgi:hypothetical protein
MAEEKDKGTNQSWRDRFLSGSGGFGNILGSGSGGGGDGFSGFDLGKIFKRPSKPAPAPVGSPGMFGGAKGETWVPEFLKNTSAVSKGADFLSSAFDDLQDKTALGMQQDQIMAGAENVARRFSGKNKWAGSPLGDRMAASILQQGVQGQAQAGMDDFYRRITAGQNLMGTATSALTNPLLQILGLGQGMAINQANIQAQKDMQPSGWEKALGFVSNIICWVARELVPERWEDARAYMIMEAPMSTLALYVKHGESLAQNLTDDDRETLTPIFEEMADRGAKYRR